MIFFASVTSAYLFKAGKCSFSRNEFNYPATLKINKVIKKTPVVNFLKRKMPVLFDPVEAVQEDKTLDKMLKIFLPPPDTLL
jgi:hypothetical protein